MTSSSRTPLLRPLFRSTASDAFGLGSRQGDLEGKVVEQLRLAGVCGSPFPRTWRQQGLIMGNT